MWESTQESKAQSDDSEDGREAVGKATAGDIRG